MFLSSFGSDTTVCVCDPRHVCTFAKYFGLFMSVMSKMRMPRIRCWLTTAVSASAPQSVRPVAFSDDTNRMFRYTDTSLCDAGQRYDFASVGRAGFVMSQT